MTLERVTKNYYSIIQGEYQGYDVYFGNRIGEDLGVKINYISTEAANRIEYLQTGKTNYKKSIGKEVLLAKNGVSKKQTQIRGWRGDSLSERKH